MNEKELREIKRRFRAEKSNVPKIVGCFVNENKEIITRISQSLPLSESLVSDKLLGVMKKSISGSLGVNLNEISFSTKQVLESEEHKLLSTLVKSSLSDEDALTSFYKKVTESVSFDSNYVILLANDKYDVFTKGDDGLDQDSCEIFSYIVCAICPVKTLPEALSFKESDSLFHAFSASGVLSSPELGFMFPAFDDRKTNIYGALYYNRSVSESYPDFCENIFASSAPMPPKAQKEAFSGCISEALSDECSLDVVRSIHTEISEMMEIHKEAKDPEPLKITKETVKSVLASCGIDDEKIKKAEEIITESFGEGAELSPKSIISANKFELKTPQVSIKIDPEHKDLVTTEVINNVKYIMIKVTGEAQLNGINISFDE